LTTTAARAGAARDASGPPPGTGRGQGRDRPRRLDDLVERRSVRSTLAWQAKPD
jgi:hypothetical protein